MKTPRKGVLVIGTDRDSSRNYLGKALEVIRAANANPGELQHATVVHEDACAFLEGLGYCDCDPTVVLGTPEEFRARGGQA